MSFYRTYRPQLISEIDNTAIREQLLTLLHKDKKDLPHAYLFSGSKGTGKTTAARIIAKIFDCEKLSKREGPCGKCEQCISIAKGNNIDVLEIDAASNRGIDEIRALRDQIHLAPVSGQFKVYIIDEVHMLTTEAFNALLKTLEEPPEHAVFVLATTDLHKVPVTIQSRCLMLSFAQAKSEELTHALSRIVRKEKIRIDKEALSLITAAADGSFRDATKLLEQVSFHRGNITAGVVRQTLSLSETKLLEQFLQYVSRKQAKEALQLIRTLVGKGFDIKTFLVDMLQNLEGKLVDDTLGRSIDPWDGARVRDAIKRFSEAYTLMKASPIAELPIELAIVEFCESGSTFEPRKDTAESTHTSSESVSPVPGMLTLEKLNEHWLDFLASLKTYNHSVSGVLRSARPKGVKDGIVTIEAFYPFHEEKLSEPKTKEVLVQAVKKLFGEKVKIEVVLGKK